LRISSSLVSVAIALVTTHLPAPAQVPDSSLITSAVNRRGFAALGEHERSKDLGDAADAARAFSVSLKADRDDVWAHYGLALTLYRANKTMSVVRTEGVADGEAAKVSVRLLERALDLDPDFILAAALLEQVAERAKDRTAQARALEVLERNGQISTSTLETAPAGALGLLQRARNLYEERDDAAATELYFAGVASWDKVAADAFIADALLIADDQENTALTDGRLEKRAAALSVFWKKRSVRDGVSIADRIGEHYRRVAYARSRFRLASAQHETRDLMGRKKTGLAAEMDDRGPVYIRYGPPTEPKAWNVERLETGLITWAYLNPDGRYTAFHFTASDRELRRNYRLVTDLLRDVGRWSLSPGAVEELGAELMDLAKYEPRYAFIAARLTTVRNMSRTPRDSPYRRTDMLIAEQSMEDVARLNERITLDNFSALAEAHQRDRAHPGFMQPLVAFHDFATFRGDGCTDFVYSVAAAAPSYRLNVAVADTFTWESQDINAVVSKETTAGEYLRATGVFCMRPDFNAFVRLTVSTDSLTGVTAGGDVTIPDYAPRSGLLMSDLLFAGANDGPFLRGNARLALVPPRQFRQNEPFRVFYELYNMPRANPYKTEITFETVRSNVFAKLFKGRSKTTVSFEDATVTGDAVQELRTLIPEVESGEVRVTIKVTDLTTRQTAAKSKTIWITPAPE
jgi:GWxTD domain-containing protein